MPVTVFEARERTGGRVNTVPFDDTMADLGGSWIHGLGPGAFGKETWIGQLNPLY
jgi:phytoene dehydrogenase-like protein